MHERMQRRQTSREFVGNLLQLGHKKPIQVVRVWVESACQFHCWVETMLLETEKKKIQQHDKTHTIYSETQVKD